MNPVIATPVEAAFYRIGNATPKELKAIEASIPELTQDADEQAELMNQILLRFGVLNSEAVPNQSPRWN